MVVVNMLTLFRKVVKISTILVIDRNHNIVKMIQFVKLQFLKVIAIVKSC